MEDKQVITLRIPYLQGIEGTPAEGSSAEIVIKDVHLWKLRQNGLALAHPLEQRIRELEDAANSLLHHMENDENVSAAFARLRAVADKSIDSYEKEPPDPVEATASGPWSSGGVKGASPPPGTDSILTWIKGLVEAAENLDGSHLYGPCEALVLARQLGWGNGKIGELPAMTTEKQEQRSVLHSENIEDLSPEARAALQTGLDSAQRGEVREFDWQSTGDLHKSFLYELQALINKHSLESRSNTPDFILASLLETVLKTWDLHTVERDRWYAGSPDAEGAIFKST